jgi:hypothetical protein
MDSQNQRASTLRNERLQQLMDSCQQGVLGQIVGPFGLTPAMFDDKDGGSVATVHNAEAGVFPDELHEQNYELANDEYSQQLRQKHWDDKSKRGKRHKEINKTFNDGGNVASAATEKPMTKGKIDGDHTVSLKEAHQNKALHLRFTEKERKEILNNEKNMAFIEESINASKREKSWEECLNDPEFIKKHELTAQDVARIKKLDKEARGHIQSEQNKRLAGELISAGAKEAGKNAMRQALGVLLHEFVSGSFLEVKRHLLDRQDQQSFIDKLVESLRRVMHRVAAKAQAALNAALQGGVQGLVSNLLTFLINNFITTSAKIVSLIRESMQNLWKAIKLIANPPEGMSAAEKARAVSKIIASVLTTGLGMLMEESVKGFIMSIPVLVPIADLLSTALTAIMTGIGGALIIYGIDRLFDWLDAKGTELLSAQEATTDAQLEVATRLQSFLSLQFENSRLYAVCSAEYQQIERTFTNTAFQMEAASVNAAVSVHVRDAMIETVESQLDRKKRLAAALCAL